MSVENDSYFAKLDKKIQDAQNLEYGRIRRAEMKEEAQKRNSYRDEVRENIRLEKEKENTNLDWIKERERWLFDSCGE